MILLLLAVFINGVCTRNVPVIISEESMGNTVALMGQDVDFTCKVDNLARHMVAFVRAGTPPRLISYDEKIFRQRDKYELKPRMGPMNNEWVLTIKNAQEKDRGNYSCQVNTDPITTVTGQLDIRVPPSVSRNTPSAVEVREGHNVTLSCKTEGNPAPTVIWRRQDRQIIRSNGATGYGASVFPGSNLQLTKVNRKHMSEYVCVASNGIPPDESWTIKLLVTFPPLVLAKESTVSVPIGGIARLVCTAESWPRPDVTWQLEGQQIFDSDEFSTSQTVSGQYHSVHILEIRRVNPDNYGVYRCTARNDNGIHFADISLEESSQDFLNTNVIPEGSGSLSDDEDSDRDWSSREAEAQPESVYYIAPVHPTQTVPTATRELRQERQSSNRPSFVFLFVLMLCLSLT